MNMIPGVHPREQAERYRADGSWGDLTLWPALQRWARERPDKAAVIDGTDGREITYEELARDVERAAGWMAQQGVGNGDTVAVQLPNRYETVVIDAAALGLGACLNPLLPHYRRKELSHFLAVTKAKLLVTPRHYRGFDHQALGQEVCAATPHQPLHLVVDSDGTALDDVLAAAPMVGWSSVDAGAVSEVIFTSGTESLPKAVMHTEQTVNHSVEATIEHLGLSADDVVWMPSPIGHSTGFNFGVRLALVLGATIVLQDVWRPERAAELIERHRCTYTLAASTFLSDVLRAAEQDGRDLSSMVYFGCGGGPVGADLVRRAADAGVEVLRIYGSTEGLIISWNRRESPRDKKEQTDGLPPRATDVEIWGSDDQPCPLGEVGEIVVRGPNVCVGFFDDPERTAATFTEDGWLRTGDLGYLDEQGYLTVSGRKKETIVRGGLNITPREIEDLLIDLPGVDDVAVVGVQDERLGEIVGVCAVVLPGAEVDLAAVLAHLERKELARYKMPQRFFGIEAMPRTVTGKLRRTELASWANDAQKAKE